MSHSPLWHPFTQHAVMPPEILIDRAAGAYLYTQDGRRIIDGISSWWINIHGHCHPKIVRAVQAQAAKLEQVIFAGFTHEPAEALAAKLMEITDPALAHVFYSDSGSTAVEVALKMVIGYWQHSGTPRTKILALEHGYHGDTFGAMAAGARSVFSAAYEPFLFDVTHIPFPEKGREGETLAALEAALKSGNVAAFILEPLVLGAGGMKMYGADTLKAMADLCKCTGALLILDEVMTGWGRTGTHFACEQAGVTPDLLCLSKGLTGGFLPMGATLCTEDIYAAFYSEDRARTFFHSSSFTGNPLACAAALASLAIWEEEPVPERIAAVARAHEKAQERFKARDDIRNVRQTGTILAMEVAPPLPPPQVGGDYLAPVGPRLYREFLKRGVLLRPLGDTVYILPPYCVTQNDLDGIYDAIEDALDGLRDEGSQRAA